TARTSPAVENSSRFPSGTSQTKWRLIRYSRPVGLMARPSTRVPTSSQPAARPAQAASASTSRGPSRPAYAGVGADPDEWVSRPERVVVHITPVPTTPMAGGDNHPASRPTTSAQAGIRTGARSLPPSYYLGDQHALHAGGSRGDGTPAGRSRSLPLGVP